MGLIDEVHDRAPIKRMKDDLGIALALSGYKPWHVSLIESCPAPK